MNKLLLLCLIIGLSSCATKHRPYFFTKEGEQEPPVEQIESLIIKIDPIKDIRQITDRHLLTASKPFIHTGDGKFCINAEKVYDSSFWNDMSNISKRYLSNFLGVKKVSVLIQDYDYRLSWSISEFWIKQKYSEEANKNRKNGSYGYYAGGAIGGLLFAITQDASKENSEMIFKSSGNINITLDDIVLYNKSGDPVKSFEPQTLLLEDFELVADADCLCAYYNLDYYFKKLMQDFSPKLEKVLIEEMK